MFRASPPDVVWATHGLRQCPLLAYVVEQSEAALLYVLYLCSWVGQGFCHGDQDVSHHRAACDDSWWGWIGPASQAVWWGWELRGSEPEVEATGEGDRAEDEDTGTSRSNFDWEATKDEGAGTSGSRAAKLFMVCVRSGLNISMGTPVARGHLLRLPRRVTYLHGWLVGSRSAPFSREEGDPFRDFE